MSLSAKYHMASGVQAVSDYLGIDPKPIVAQAGLPLDFLGGPERLVTGPQYYALWEGIAAAAPDGDLPKVLSDLVLHGDQDPSGHAFYSSATVRIGMQRKALFKPLVMPIRFELSEAAPQGAVEIIVSSPIAGRRLPDIIGWFNMVFLLSIARKATGAQIMPLRVEVAAQWLGWDYAPEVFGLKPEVTGRYALALAGADMDRPLITRTDASWAGTAGELEAHFAAQTVPGSTAARVRQTLLEGLPGGRAGADQVARQMGLSKRGLQRRLGAEDVRFKEILEDTRRALALSYLQRGDLGMQEIALLLGFRDASSFFRAFKGWTGQTPGALRGTG